MAKSQEGLPFTLLPFTVKVTVKISSFLLGPPLAPAPEVVYSRVPEIGPDDATGAACTGACAALEASAAFLYILRICHFERHTSLLLPLSVSFLFLTSPFLP